MARPFTSFREVIDLWESPAAMASDIGATVHSARKWAFRRSIPAEWWLSILETETARRARLTAEDLAALAAKEPVEIAKEPVEEGFRR